MNSHHASEDGHVSPAVPQPPAFEGTPVVPQPADSLPSLLRRAASRISLLRKAARPKQIEPLGSEAKRRLSTVLRPLAERPARALLLTGTSVAALLSFVAFGAGTLPPLVELSSKPLHSATFGPKPTLTLALSVEFPTNAAQYRDAYSNATEYIGYFDSESCYSYVNDVDPALRRFDRIGPATARACGGTGFSGNFMNWATSSAVDVLRLGLTGGDRWIDTDSMTVLQRAVLPQDHGWYWNNSWYFPSKVLKAGALANGAVPATLRGSHTGDIYIANCLNRVHFGTAVTFPQGSPHANGGCGAAGANANLGSTTGPAMLEVSATPSTAPLPSDFVHCANLNANCSFTGVYQVAFGDTTNGWKFVPYYKGTRQSTFKCDPTWFSNWGNWTVPGTDTRTCKMRPMPAPTDPPAAGSQALTGDGFFYTRVKVCESTSGVLDDPRAAGLADKERALCMRYPSGNYKPVGQLQMNGNEMRVAAFGYLMHDGKMRYGGVLRAPMKFVGNQTYDGTGAPVSGGNPKMEWNENTGVFAANPEGAAEGKSGVINYLNQFGRTGYMGRYKSLDPLSELYYEALRYLQGLPPTPDATAGMTVGQKDGFPVYDTWTDPHADGSNTRNYSCSRNSILVLGDVWGHADKSIPGNTTRLDLEFSRPANPSANEPDFHHWTRVVGGFESNNPVSYIDGNGASRFTSNPNPVVNAARWGLEDQQTYDFCSDGITCGAYYMAGIAYWARTHDIRGAGWSDEAKRRPGMRVTTYMLDVNENGSQNNTTARRNNVAFLSAKYGGFEDRSGIGNPFLNDAGTLDNSSWESPEAPGEANNYYQAGKPRIVLKSIAKIFSEARQKANSIGGAAVSTQRLTTAAGHIYQAQYDPAAWNGDLLSIPVNYNTTTQVVSLATAPQWSAAARLDVRDPGTRNIVVGKRVADLISAATPFTWTEIESSLAAALHLPGPGLAADNRGQDRLNYLRGDRTHESNAPLLRRRASTMGDVINSGVAYSGTPTQAIGDSGYAAFYSANKNRTKAVFVGANDGMLHAFDAATGDELFGYIPSWMGPKLSILTDESYHTKHTSYVDASPVTGEALVGSNWKTVLVGGTGAGGQGVYALDVTNPAAFDPGKVMWEFTDRDDVDMGNVIGRPQIRKFRISAPGAATPVYKWFAVVASGVNNYASDGFASTTAQPALFLLDLAKPVGMPWALGSNYYKISLPAHSQIETARATGVANFSLTTGDADEVVHMYVGDLHGQMWKLDFSLRAASGTNWTLDKLSSFKTNGGRAFPLFVAKDAAGVPQPITMAPNLPVGPKRSTVVAFGTGKYLEQSDNVVDAATQVQTLYAILDDRTNVADASPASGAAISGRGRLQAGSFATGGTLSMPSFTWGKATADSDVTARSGWYADLPRGGERQVGGGTMFGTYWIFGSVLPPVAATGTCSTGSGYQYTVDLLTGAGSSNSSTVGPIAQPLVFEMGSGNLTTSDSTGRRQRTGMAQIVLLGAAGNAVPQGTGPSGGKLVKASYPGRLSWRRLDNYWELKNSPASEWVTP